MIRHKLKILTFFFFIFPCLLSTFDSAFSQQGLTPMQRRQLEVQIGNLKHRIIQVEQLLRAFNHDLARSFLDEAKKLGQQIDSDFRQRKYLAVQTKIRNANAFLDKVLALATDKTLKRLINDLNRVMRQAEHEVIGSGNKDAERMLQSGKSHQERAGKALRNGNIKRAYEQLTVAITFAKKALDLVRNTCEREHARFENLAGRAKNTVDASNNNRAKRIFDQAYKSFTLAEQACREGRTDTAAQMYNRAIRLLLRALDMTSTADNINEINLRHQLETVKELLNSVKNRLDNYEQTPAGVLLRRIESNISKAENLIVLGRFRLAKIQLATARRMLESILRTNTATADDTQERAESELEILQQDLARLKSETSPEKIYIKEFLQFSAQAATQARQDIASGNYGSALQRILIGQKFLAKAENLRRGGRTAVTEVLASRSIDRLKQLLQEAESVLNTAKTSYVARLLADAKAMLRQAENKHAEKKYILSLELSEVGKELITTAMRISQPPD